MSTADTNRVSLFLGEEVVWGEAIGTGPNAPKLYEVRMTGETLGHTKQTVTSETIRTDRMRDGVYEVGASAEGDINFELAANDWDLMMEAALATETSWILERVYTAVAEAVAATNRFEISAGSFALFRIGAQLKVEGFTNRRNNGLFTITDVGADFIEVEGNALADETVAGDATFKSNHVVSGDLVIATATTITSAGLDFTTLNLEVGQRILSQGFTLAGNNKVLEIAAIAAGTLTFVASGLTAAAADADAFLVGKRIKNGIVAHSFLLEKQFGDIDQFVQLTGMRPGSFSMNVESQAIVTSTVSFQGKEGQITGATVSGVRQTASITDAMNATTNVGSLREGGIDLATGVRALSLEVNNNLRMKPRIGSRSPIDIGYGFMDLTGTVNAYFEDEVLYQKMISHSQTSLEFRFTDSAGNIIHIEIPRLYFTTGNPTTPSGNEDVMLELEWTAVRDPSTNSMILMDLLSV